MRHALFLILAGAVLAACATQGRPIAGQTVDEDYAVGGFQWQSGATVYVLAKTFRSGENVGLCVAWTARGGINVLANAHREVIAAGSVFLDGTRVHQGLGFGNEIGPEGDVIGKASNCIETSTPWRAEFENAEPKPRFPRMRVDL